MPKYIQLSGNTEGGGFYETAAQVFQAEIEYVKNIVFIATRMSDYEGNDLRKNLLVQGFRAAGIEFENAELIDLRTPQETQKQLIEKASVVYLMGGETVTQFAFLEENQLIDVLKNIEAVVIGLSAGAMNMAKHVTMPANAVRTGPLNYEGIGLVDCTVLPHFNSQSEAFIQEKLLPLSHDKTVYGMHENGVILHKNGVAHFYGDVVKMKDGIILKD